MKHILICAIILFFISLQANGQQSQDTLYLKDGSKAGGKLLKASKTEYRFQTSDGVVFTFTPDVVEKFVPAKVPAINKSLNTLTFDELNLYLDKAVKLRNTGRLLTLGGIGIAVTGFVLMTTQYSRYSASDYIVGTIVFLCFAASGVIVTLVGIPLWVEGGNRKTKAELALKKFDVVQENSMAIGLGITIRF